MEHKQNVAQITRLLKERKTTMRSYAALMRFLVLKGIKRSIAEEITLEFSQQGLEMDSLPGLIAKRIRTTDTPVEQASALVGPTGVGKSTLASKLEESLPNLYDTPGCNFYQPEMVDVIGEELAEQGVTEVWLVLSASMQEIDLYGAIHQFSALQPTALIFTKLDETLAPGVILNICAKTQLPIRYVTTEHMCEQAEARKITHHILAEYNNPEYAAIRQLAYSEII